MQRPFSAEYGGLVQHGTREIVNFIDVVVVIDARDIARRLGAIIRRCKRGYRANNTDVSLRAMEGGREGGLELGFYTKRSRQAVGREEGARVTQSSRNVNVNVNEECRVSLNHAFAMHVETLLFVR